MSDHEYLYPRAYGTLSAAVIVTLVRIKNALECNDLKAIKESLEYLEDTFAKAETTIHMPSDPIRREA